METKALKVKPSKVLASSVGCDYIAIHNTVGDEPAKKRRANSKPKAQKDPNKPKKALSAFMFFSTETRPKVKSDNPDMKFGDIAREISAQWKDLAAEPKKKFDKMAAQDKIRYEKEMEAYMRGTIGSTPRH